MKTTRATAGHQIAKGNKKEQQQSEDRKALALAKVQETQKKGRYVWNPAHRAYFLTVSTN